MGGDRRSSSPPEPHTTSDSVDEHEGRSPPFWGNEDTRNVSSKSLEISLFRRGYLTNGSADPEESVRKLPSLRKANLLAPPRPVCLFSVLGEVGLKCVTKLAVCHVSIRFIHPGMSCLKMLRELDLSFNKLKILPNDIADLTSLRILKVANNKLTDLPPGLSSLSRLEKLDLSRNSEGTVRENVNEEIAAYAMQVDVYDVAANRNGCYRKIDGSSCRIACLPFKLTSCRCHASHSSPINRKGWKRRDYLQQMAREERLNHSRKGRGDISAGCIPVKMVEEICFALPLVEGAHANSSLLSEDIGDSPGGCDAIDCDRVSAEKIVVTDKYRDEASCLTSESSVSSMKYISRNLKVHDDCVVSSYNPSNLATEDGHSAVNSKPKRHSDKDLDNPKPSKFQRRPVRDHSTSSYKYNVESICTVEDYLLDGFCDAGRDRPLLSLDEYEQNFCLDSREVILLDREQDEELDAITLSARMLLSSFRRSVSSKKDDLMLDDLQRASILGLFVSDFFGGSDKSNLIGRMRRAAVGSVKQQPFVCTCFSKSVHAYEVTSQLMYGLVGSHNFSDLCDQSLRLIKAARNSNVIPIGALRFGVCRHRAVLMKYLCDRADPPIPCELVRGYLDFMPHAWNVVLIRRGDSLSRMVVDACFPADIREETDPEFFCRYMPLSRFLKPLTIQSSSNMGCSLFSDLLDIGSNEQKPRFVRHAKVGAVDTAVKVDGLEISVATDEERRKFEYKFLGEVRMLGALRGHKCIVEIYGHHLSCNWGSSIAGSKKKVLCSIIAMEYIKGGSLKNYLEKLSRLGEKHVPANLALSVARDVACALVEVHSKSIIHRDVKSENILIDLECKRSDGTPVVKLSDFDRSVPLHSSDHTCCIAHHGVHPPYVCVGTPRWMAPEVVEAIDRRNPYGLEVDIWSYGCLIYELLTLKIPYNGHSDSELYRLLKMQERPRLPHNLELLSWMEATEVRSRLGLASDNEADVLKVLVDLFYECTKVDPANRPTARYIYDKLYHLSLELAAAE